MIEYKGIQWYIYQGALLPNVSPHYEINLSYKEQKELLKISKALFLRYTNEWDRNSGEFWYVIKDQKEELESYNSNNRRKIRKGLKNCIVKKVSNNIIARNGYDVYKNAFLNYKTESSLIKEEYFKESILNAIGNDFWAVYKKEEDGIEKMIAYSQNIIGNKSVNYSTIKFHPKYQRLYSSYALFFEMNKYYIDVKNFLYVSDGARSISHDSNIQNFLIDKFKFRKAFVKLNVSYRWDVKLAVVLLYPLRGIISKIEHSFFNKISIILKQENIRRSFEK